MQRRQRYYSMFTSGKVGSAMRIRSHADGNHGTLYFECLWMDVDTGAVGAHAFTNMTLIRVHEGWLVKAIRVGKVDQL